MNEYLREMIRFVQEDRARYYVLKREDDISAVFRTKFLPKWLPLVSYSAKDEDALSYIDTALIFAMNLSLSTVIAQTTDAASQLPRARYSYRYTLPVRIYTETEDDDAVPENGARHISEVFGLPDGAISGDTEVNPRNQLEMFNIMMPKISALLDAIPPLDMNQSQFGQRLEFQIRLAKHYKVIGYITGLRPMRNRVYMEYTILPALSHFNVINTVDTTNCMERIAYIPELKRTNSVSHNGITIERVGTTDIGFEDVVKFLLKYDSSFGQHMESLGLA
jgi:hypothetical protein